MTKIVARRNKDGQIVMLRKPEEPRYVSEGDVRLYRQQYQEYRKPGAVNYYAGSARIRGRQSVAVRRPGQSSPRLASAS